MNAIWQDVRYALRQLRNAPSFALISVGVLALGLGANIAVFTLLSGILLRPLPYAQPDQIVKVELSGPMPYYSLTLADMLQLRDAVGQRMEMGAVLYGPNVGPSSVTGPGGRVQIRHAEATADLFGTLGVQPVLGRGFRADEDTPGKSDVAIIGNDVWRTLYHSDPHVLGTTMRVRNRPFTIVGVLPKGFFLDYNREMMVWSPAPLTQASRTKIQDEQSRWGEMYARLPDGMMASQLQADLARAQANIARGLHSDDVPAAIKVTELQMSMNAQARRPLLLVYAVVCGIWVLAWLNVTSLMLARAVSRTREQAVRSALGASRARLLQQTIVESLLLSCAGAFFGFLLGQATLKILWKQLERKLPLTFAVHVDWRVGAWFAGLTLLTAMLTGVFPAMYAMRRDVRARLSGATTTSSAKANRVREVLVVGQLALALVFLVGAGLFLRTVRALRSVPLGFSEQNVLTGGVIMNGAGQAEDGMQKNQPNVVTTYYAPLLDRLKAMPGVKAVALSSVLPLRSEFQVTVSGGLDHKKDVVADGRLASAGLVNALGIPMVRGRFFTDDDTASAPAVVVVNKAFVEKYLPGEDAIGHTFSMGKGHLANARIVGVIGDVKQTDVMHATRPEAYFCLPQIEPQDALYGIATAFMQVAIRAEVPANTLRAQFDRALHQVAPYAATTDVETIHQAVEDSFGSETLIARMLESLAGIALMIASVGLYGLLSFAIAQRTREIGVRMALGAQQRNILSLVLRRALLLVIAGLGLGLSMAWFASRLAGSYVFGVRPHDAMTFLAVAAVLAIASGLAAWMPARRAATIDPIKALRTE